MEERLREILREKISKGFISIPNSWNLEDAIRYYEYVPQRLWGQAILHPQRMAPNKRIYKRLDEALIKIEKMKKRRLTKKKEELERLKRFYGFNPQDGTIDLIRKNDLTLGTEARIMGQIKRAAILRIKEVRRKAEAKNMVKAFDDAVDMVLNMAKNQDERGIYFALSTMADSFEKQLQGIATKRIEPRADGGPAKKPTQDEDDEEEEEY